WKAGSRQPTISAGATDRLYRNVGGRFFIDATRDSSLSDMGFGQGCSVGDFDNDGFPDLYVANIGRNQLHHNNGDGTFTDVSDVCGIEERTWTTSCVIVDL